MLSFDGSGYGQSTCWDYTAKHVAIETKEICPCWDKSPKHVQMGYDTSRHKNVLIQVICPVEGCNQNFEKATETLTKKFLEFYQI